LFLLFAVHRCKRWTTFHLLFIYSTLPTTGVIGRYERNEVKPSIDVATKMAEVLKVSLDYLVGFAEHELDHSLTQKILDIQKLNDEDKIISLKLLMHC